MVSVAVRASPVFSATVSDTLPLPVPEAPDAIAIHSALELAVQPQEEAVVTATSVEPPFAGAL